MSSGPSSGNRRRRKKDEDHISNLPDTILCYILSFLTTKSAVKTSILSKRWKYLWTKVPTLDFTGVIYDRNVNNFSYKWLSLEQKTCFKNFMDKVLLHNDASYVQRFCLSLYDVEAFYCNSWLIAASRREMHELDIVLDQTLDVCLPPRFLLSEKLVVLKLEGSIIISASVPFHLPNLETIHLSHLMFLDDEFMNKLSSSCPVLRELHIVSCCVKATTLCVESLTLKSLSMSNTSSIQDIEQVHIVIKTPNLTYLSLQEYHVSFDVGDMSSLIEATFTLGGIAKQIEKLITKVSGVKTLHLMISQPLQESSKLKKLPVFPNLTMLKCGAHKLLSNSLCCTPKLKSLSLRYLASRVDSLFDPKFAPEHLPCLESIVMDGFSGQVKEVEIVAYFLKVASALREMKINLSYTVTCTVTTAVSVFQKLLNIPRSSAVCQVKITTPSL